MKYTIACSLENLKGLRDFIKESLQSFGVSGMAAEEMVLAVDEMVANRMIHTHRCDPKCSLDLILTFNKNENSVIIDVIDEGNIFDINEFTQPAIEDIIHERRKGGLGIRLVRSIMDKIEYISQDSRTICRMTKKIAS